jgi:hypothetical protein
LVLRRISEQIRSKDWWSIRKDNGLQKFIKGEHIAKYTKSRRLKHWGHIGRTEETEVVKKISDWNPVGVRTKVRPTG